MQRFAPVVCLLWALVLCVVGCKQDDLVRSAADDVDKLATDVVQTVSASDDKMQGIADAQAVVEQRKPELQAKMVEVADLRGFQASDEAMQELARRRYAAIERIEGLQTELMAATVKDPELKRALEGLSKAFTETVEPLPSS
jgi:hypothetical protein